MANYTVYNKYTDTTDNVIDGSSVYDHLTYIYNAETTGVSLSRPTANTTLGGYNGWFNGMGYNDASFRAIDAFTFIDYSSGNDVIYTAGGNDTIRSGGGNDTLDGGGGIDVLDGGAGIDYVGGDKSFATSAININLNGTSSYLGSGSVAASEGFSDFRTGSGNDTLTGHASSGLNDKVYTNGGNDLVTLWFGGTDRVYAGTGDDRLVVTYNVETSGVAMSTPSANTTDGGYNGWFNGMGYNDINFWSVEHFTFTDLSGGNDSIYTAGGDDVLKGGGGDDTLHGGQGIDVLDGGAGIDFVGGDKSFATTAMKINLNTTSTYLGTGSVANFEAFKDFRTGSGNDTIIGKQTTGFGDVANGFNDTIRTNAGNDSIKLWAGGTDNVHGGTGNDRLTLIYDLETTGVAMSMPSVNADDGGYNGWFNGMGYNDTNFKSIEHFTFSDLSKGNDYINTGDGNDVLSGGGGNDTLNSGKGTDRVNGGAGTDFWGADLTQFSANQKINLNYVSKYNGWGYAKKLEGFSDFSTGAGNDKITAHKTSGLNDMIDSGAGNDTVILSFGGTDRIYGGSGNDTLKVTYDVETTGVALGMPSVNEDDGGYNGWFNGAGYNDINFWSIENLWFTDLSGGNDSINTGGGNDVLLGGKGKDTLNSGGGIDQVNGGKGLDVWGADTSDLSGNQVFNLNTTSTYGGFGWVKNVEAFSSLQTGAGNDRITGTAAYLNDTIRTGAGNDIITLRMSGTDRVYGEKGNDTLKITANLADSSVSMSMPVIDDETGGYNGWLNGKGYNDTNFWSIENFWFTDKAGGNDKINTGSGKDVLNGGGGNDVLNSGGGVDKINGGTGDDYWGTDLSTTGKSLTFNLNTVSTYMTGGRVENVEGFSSLKTGWGADKVTGHRTANMNDKIDTGGGKDVISLWSGGTDTVDGGKGFDRLVLIFDEADSGVGLSVSANAQSGFDGWYNGPGYTDLNFKGIEAFTFTSTVTGNDALTTGDGVDKLRTGAGNDTVNAGGGADLVWGADGADTLRGQAGNDKMYGGNGADTLEGGGGADKLFGDGGDDILRGGDQADKLDGGAGSDSLYGNGGADSFVLRTRYDGTDMLYDFEDGIDTILLNGVKYGGLRITDMDNGALIEVASTGQDLAQVIGVDASDLTFGDFGLI